MTLRYRWMGFSLAVLLCSATPVRADDAGGLALEQAARSQLSADAPQEEAPISEDPVERARFTVDIFRATCYDDFFDQQKIRDWAGANLTPMAGTAKQVALAVVHADSGDVWSARIPGGAHYNRGQPSGGEIALVLEPGGRCHVLSFGTDNKAVHNAMSDLSQTLRKAQPDKTVDYKYVNASEAHPFDESMIGIISPLNNPDARDPTMVILGDTASGGLNDITAVISMYANFDPNGGSGQVAVATPVASAAAVSASAHAPGAPPDDKPLFQTVPLKVSSYTRPAIPLNVPGSSPAPKLPAIAKPAAAPNAPAVAAVSPAASSKPAATVAVAAHPAPAVLAPAAPVIVKPVSVAAVSAPMPVVPPPKGFSAASLNAAKLLPVGENAPSTIAPAIPRPFPWGHTASASPPGKSEPVKTASAARKPPAADGSQSAMYADPAAISPAAGPAVARMPVTPVEREKAPPL